MLELSLTQLLVGSAAISVVSFSAGVVVMALLGISGRADDGWAGRTVRDWDESRYRDGSFVDGAGGRR